MPCQKSYRHANLENKMYEYVFFFQAEDGIRDDLVTGVQTCALLIFGLGRSRIHHCDPRIPDIDAVFFGVWWRPLSLQRSLFSTFLYGGLHASEIERDRCGRAV